MHMLWCDVKAHLILKCLKNRIERSLVSGKMQLSVEGKRNGKAWSIQNKITLVVSGEREHGVLVLFWVKFYRLIVFGVEAEATHKGSNLNTVKRGKNIVYW